MSVTPHTPNAREVPPPSWRVRGREIVLERPLLLAVLNVTPDSFSDGGRFTTLPEAMARVEQAIDEGADGVDIGGESTRPGAPPIAGAEQLRRLLPVLTAARRAHNEFLITIDTTSAEVARVALAEGANAINDVSGLRLDDTLAGVVAEARGGLILMHSRGGAGELSGYANAEYDGDVEGAVQRELLESVSRARAGGIADASIVLDPGVGFAKRPDASVAVLRALPQLAALGFPLLVGASRKRMVGALIGEPAGHRDPSTRLFGTVGVHVASLALGARLFRVHDVKAHRQALDAAWALLSPRPS